MKNLLIFCVVFILATACFSNCHAQNLVFEIDCKPSMGFENMVGGYNVRLYSDGKVYSYQYKMFSDVVTNEFETTISKEYVEEILALIAETDLQNMPKIINNETLDGDMYYFNFNGIATSVDNIMQISDDELKKYSYNADQIKNFKYQGFIIELINKISDVLLRSGHTLGTDGLHLTSDTN